MNINKWHWGIRYPIMGAVGIGIISSTLAICFLCIASVIKAVGFYAFGQPFMLLWYNWVALGVVLIAAVTFVGALVEDFK